MRASLVLLVALAACSDSNGPHQIPVLTTHLSNTVVSDGSEVIASLTALNPTDTTLHVSFYAMPPVVAEIKVSGQWQTGFSGFGDGFGGPGPSDTLSLAPGADTSLGSIGMTFGVGAISETLEHFTLPAGTYSVRACFYPTVLVVQGGDVAPASCGNTVRLTVAQ